MPHWSAASKCPYSNKFWPVSGGRHRKMSNANFKGALELSRACILFELSSNG